MRAGHRSRPVIDTFFPVVVVLSKAISPDPSAKVVPSLVYLPFLSSTVFTCNPLFLFRFAFLMRAYAQCRSLGGRVFLLFAFQPTFLRLTSHEWASAQRCTVISCVPRFLLLEFSL